MTVHPRFQIAAPPRTTTIEKRTRMKPSEALEIGRIAHPQVSRAWEDCAVGIINTVRGDFKVSVTHINQDGHYQFFQNPCEHSGRQMLAAVIMHLSDDHSQERNKRKGIYRIFSRKPQYWSQDDIINWLKSNGL
jgi:hypothetical protein